MHTRREKNKIFAEPLWHFSYPTSAGEVKNIAVRKFQTGIVTLREANRKKILEDFTRNFYLNGKLLDKDTSIEMLVSTIKKFVATSRAYTKNDCHKIAEYLMTRGGQDHNFLVQNLVTANHFTDDNYQAKSSICQNFIDANWRVNANGKIELNYCTDLLSLEVTTNDNPSILT